MLVVVVVAARSSRRHVRAARQALRADRRGGLSLARRTAAREPAPRGRGAVREAEIRQMLEARNEPGVRRGQAPLDIEAELRGAHAPADDRSGAARRGAPARGRPQRAPRPPGKPPLDVEAEVARQAARARVVSRHRAWPTRAASTSRTSSSAPGRTSTPRPRCSLVVDDSPELDAEIFEDDDGEGEWVLIGDDVPLDERAARRDASSASRSATTPARPERVPAAGRRRARTSRGARARRGAAGALGPGAGAR